jgi:hypothetical protein
VGVVALRVGSSLSHTSPATSQGAYRIAFVLLSVLGATAVLNAVAMHPSAGDALRTVRSPRKESSGD